MPIGQTGLLPSLGLAIATGILYALGQPGWNAWPLAFVCGVPLFAAVSGRRLAARLGLGWLAGTVATAGSTLVPAAVSANAYFGVPMWQAWLIALGVAQLFGAASFALLAGLAGPLAEASPARNAWRIALAWTGAETLRSTAFTGLPWLLLGQSLTPVPGLIQLAAWAGTPGLTFALAWVNACLWAALDAAQRRRALILLTAAAALFAAAWLASPVRSGRVGPGSVVAPGEGGEQALRVLLVQGNFPGERRGASRQIPVELARLVQLSDVPDIDLAIWPENAMRAVLPTNAELLDRAWRTAKHRPASLLLGAPRFDPQRPTELSNAALLFGADGQPLGHHDKVHLLPFGEYVPSPFRALGLRGRDTAAGERPRVLEAAGRRIGALVCFEVAFEGLTVALVRDGSELLVNLSNDGWFARTDALEQHFSAAILRAVEAGRPVLRSTNTGITAAVDAFGRVVARAPVFEAATVAVDVLPGGPRTLYTRTGNVVGPGCLAIALLLCAVATRRTRRIRTT